jgi:hypothetical protein
MADNQERIATLERKLAARRGTPGFKDNVIAIEAEIARLKGEEGENAG